MEGIHSTGKLTLAAYTGLAASLAGATALHVGWPHQVDTFRHTLSDYALSDSAGPVFAGTVVCLAAGSAALLAGLVRARLPIGLPATVLLGAWCGGLTLAAVFPTDPPGGVAPTWYGLVHRYAAGTAVATLPAAGLLIARRLGGLPGWSPSARSLRRTSWASLAAGLGFFGAHLCTTLLDTPAARSVSGLLGLTERITLALETVLLFVLAGAMRGAGRRHA